MVKRPKVYVAKSSIAGKGIFAAKNFKTGETIFIPKGKIEQSHHYTRWESKRYQHALAIGPHQWIHTSRSDPLWNLNHSCEPNACVRGVKKIVALRDIQKGEEITIDYTLTEEDPYWEMTCSCKTPSCRNHIQSLPLMPREFKQTHRDHIATWLKKYIA